MHPNPPLFFQLFLGRSFLWAGYFEVEQISKVCPQCGVMRLNLGTGEAHITEGRKWVDCFGQGSLSYPSRLYNRRVIDTLHAAGDHSAVAHDVSIEVRSSSLHFSPKPKIVWVQTAHGLGLDQAASGSTYNPIACNVCERREIVPGFMPLRNPVFIPLGESWTGADLFHGHFRSELFCSLRFVEMARKERWTNLLFTPIDVPFDPQHERINPLAKEWPPASWYPAGTAPLFDYLPSGKVRIYEERLAETLMKFPPRPMV